MVVQLVVYLVDEMVAYLDFYLVVRLVVCLGDEMVAYLVSKMVAM